MEGFLQTFHLKIFFNLNSISTAFQNVFSQCPQCGLCLKFAADPSDKNFNNEFVPEGEEGILNCSGKMLMTMLAMMIRVGFGACVKCHQDTGGDQPQPGARHRSGAPGSAGQPNNNSHCLLIIIHHQPYTLYLYQRTSTGCSGQPYNKLPTVSSQ